MKNLIPIIGKAPCEREFEEWLEQVREQRNRTREAITSFLSKPKAKPKTRGISKTAINKALKDAGISPDELIKALEAKDGGDL